VDQVALANVPAFSRASAELAAYKGQLDRELSREMGSTRDAAAQQQLARTFSVKLEERRRRLLEPLFARARIAVASVASSKNLSVVLDKRTVIAGGQDITKNVVDLLTGIGDPVPPISTPPPSDIGYFDQARIDALPAMKSATDSFSAFRAAEQQRAETAARKINGAAQRQALLQEYQKRTADKQKTLIDPLVARAKAAIADVARKKNLVLVIERGDVMYGGTDVTADVVKELGGS
jgi:outer membrane protein